MPQPLASQSALLEPAPSLLLLVPVVALVALVVWREVLVLLPTPAPALQHRLTRLVRILTPIALLLLLGRTLLIMS